MSQVKLAPMTLPQRFSDWFAARGWAPRDQQLAVLEHARNRQSVLLISPTGGGKTLAGFLPSLTEITGQPRAERTGIHTLYISPLKALAVDIARNLEAPIAEMALPVTVETRTGDTPHSRRLRQRRMPPDILITTPEQVSLLVADPHAAHMMKNLRVVILDELHSLVTSKRGVLLSLALTRVQSHAPDAIRIGLSATVTDPETLCAWLVPTGTPPAPLVLGQPGSKPNIRILKSVERVPWAGHSALYAIPEIYDEIRKARMTLVFVNTRSQSEVIFQSLWDINDDNLAIAIHHGSLAIEQRRKVEAFMGASKLRAVVCTSTLELGIDWGDVDLVIHVGAPKGSSRLLQRIGRSNHKLDLPSEALLVPSNRFEVLECEAAIHAAQANAQDTEYPMVLKLDVLAQHILGRACAGPFMAGDLHAEVISAWTYRNLTRADFDKAVEFVATGGYALKAYERFAKLKRQPDGAVRLAHPRLAMAYRLNMGTIVADGMVKVRLARVSNKSGRRFVSGGRNLGDLDEWFLSQLTTGDTFLFAGQVLRFEGLDEFGALATRSSDPEPRVPIYGGGKFPLSTYLAARVREVLANSAEWGALPAQVHEWLDIQSYKSIVPKASQMLVETFPRAGRYYMVCYPFEGRLAHQTLGMLLTRRLERLGLQPMGFMASEYALVIWGLRDISLAIEACRLSLARLFGEDMLGDDLEEWLAESALMKRSFRNAAFIAGMIERRQPGKERNLRQMTVNTDLIYDVLRSHEPDHLLLRAAWDDAGEGLIDVHRLAVLLKRIRGEIVHRALNAASPLSVPVMLEIGRESVYGEGHDALLAEAADNLIGEAMRIV